MLVGCGVGWLGGFECGVKRVVGVVLGGWMGVVKNLF